MNTYALTKSFIPNEIPPPTPLPGPNPICISLYQSNSLSVSECVWMFPNYSETANPSDLKFWGMIPLGMEKVLG